MAAEDVTLRARSGLWIAVVVWMICIANVVLVVVQGDWKALIHVVPVVLLASFLAWMVFVVPAVVIGTHHVVLVNIVRDIRIPWSAITDVQPGFTLILRTEQKAYRAWAAPGGSGVPAFVAGDRAAEMMTVAGASPRNDDRLLAGVMDAGQSSHTTAAVAAAAIRRGWITAREQGQSRISDEAATVVVRWRTGALVILAILLVASVIGFSVS